MVITKNENSTIQSKDYFKALTQDRALQLKAALEANPNQGQYWLSYIDALIQTGQMDVARMVLAQGRQRGLQGEAVDALARHLEGPSSDEVNRLIDLFNQERYIEGEDIAHRLTLRFPQAGFAWKMLGVMLKLQGRSTEALEPMQKAVELLPRDAEAHSNLGVNLKEQGRLTEAEAIYRRALEIKPDFAEAHNNLGNTLRDQGRLTESEASCRRAVEIKPDYAEAHSNLGVTLQALGRLTEAEASYRRALEIKPDFAETHNYFGNTLRELGRLIDAESSYRRAVEIKPDYAEAHSNLGVTLQALGRLTEAEASYRRALEIKPDFAETHNYFGNTLRELGRLTEAESSYRRALEIKPDFAEAHSNLGVTLQALGRLTDAEASYRRALEIKPDYAEVYSNLGNTLRDQGRLTESEASYRRTLEIKPDLAETHNNLGITLMEQGRFTESEASYRRALEIKPDYSEAKYNMSLLLLLLGCFEEGWEKYEWRWGRKESPGMPDFGRPLWLGETSIQGKCVQLWGEQGVGDSIQFLRYTPRVANLAAEVFVRLPSTLTELVQRSFKSVKVLAERGLPVKFDYHCPLMSLALAFRTFSESDIPSDVPYLTPDPEKQSKWRKRLEKDDKLLVGIAWRGNSRHKNDRNRSIPFELLRGLLEIDQIRWVILQKPLENKEVLQLKQLAHCVVVSDELIDFDETAAVTAELDLMISVDTAVAHLAGALGKPVWVLLPYVPDWRWLLDREGSPWYPSARLFRQPKIGDWNSVVQRIAHELCSARLS